MWGIQNDPSIKLPTVDLYGYNLSAGRFGGEVAGTAVKAIVRKLGLLFCQIVNNVI